MRKFDPDNLEQNIERLLEGLSSSPTRMGDDFRSQLKAKVRQQVQINASPQYASTRIWPRLLRRGFAFMAALVLLVVSYLLFTIPEQELATLAMQSGESRLERQIGFFGLSYPVEYTVLENEGFILRENDKITLGQDALAQIIFADESLVELSPEAEVSIQSLKLSADQQDTPKEIILALSQGRLVSNVQTLTHPDSRFQIRTTTANVSVQGTIFRTTIIDEERIHVATDEGVVTLQINDQSSDIPAGFESEANINLPLTVFPQPPTLQVDTAIVSPAQPPQTNTPIAASNRPKFAVMGKTLPDSQVRLFLNEEVLGIVSTDSTGQFRSEFTVPEEGGYKLSGQTILQNEVSSRRSRVIEIDYDITPPSLAIIEPVSPQLNTPNITLVGQTEPHVRVTVNEIPVEVNNLGQFTLPLALTSGQNTLNIIAIDLAGNIQQTNSILTLQ